MNLSEFQKEFGIKRIDFSKVKETGLEEQYGTDKLICPYCEAEFDFDSEDINDILGGTVIQCPKCEMNIRVTGEMSIETTCTPIEDAIIYNKSYIEKMYKHVDECEKKGMEFPSRRFGFLEWDVFAEWARPLFENDAKREGKHDS